MREHNNIVNEMDKMLFKLSISHRVLFAVCVGLQGIMGNTESVVVQKRLTRFRPEERPVVEGVFDRLQAGTGVPSGKTPGGKTVTLEMLKV